MDHVPTTAIATPRVRIAGALLACTLVAATPTGVAQVPGQEPAAPIIPYPGTAVAPAPGQFDPAIAQFQPGTATAMPPRSRIRDVFANSIAFVAQATGAAAVTGLSGAIAGSITGWFSRKLAPAGANGAVAGAPAYAATYPAAPAYPAAATYPTVPAYPSSSTYPTAPAYPTAPTDPAGVTYPSASTYPSATTYPSASTYPATPSYPTASSAPATPSYADTSNPYATANAAAPSTASPPAYPSAYPTAAPSVAAAPAYYDPATGASVPPYAASGGALAADSADVHAGLAYEIHLLQAGGATVPVDPATYEFRSGERFVVVYRPTLPGRIEVFNVNSAGRESFVDATDVAAAQLSRLGPYEFAATTGDEILRLVLTPCTTPQLALTTRDIVRVSDGSPAGPAGLASCASVATRSARSLQTRDIRKVALDGATGFALDPVSAQELSTGRLAPRQVTIRFRHR